MDASLSDFLRHAGSSLSKTAEGVAEGVASVTLHAQRSTEHESLRVIGQQLAWQQ
jgi:hypothetical protein